MIVSILMLVSAVVVAAENSTSTSVAVSTPAGLFVDSAGNIYYSGIGDKVVRKINAKSKRVATVAGTWRTAGSGGDGSAATSATIGSCYQIWVSTMNEIYFTDYENSRVRMVSASGIIFRFAGGTGGTTCTTPCAPTSCGLYQPFGVFGTSTGIIYISDTGNNRIRKVENGVLTTYAGGGVDLLSGVPATSTAIYSPRSMFVTTDGSLYFADTSSNRIRMISPTGIMTTIAGQSGYGLLVGDDGPLSYAVFNTPSGVWVTSTGDIYVADNLNHRIRMISQTNNIITSVAGTGIKAPSTGLGLRAGDGGLAIKAYLDSPRAVCYHALTNSILIADNVNGRIRKVTLSDGIITTLQPLLVEAVGMPIMSIPPRLIFLIPTLCIVQLQVMFTLLTIYLYASGL